MPKSNERLVLFVLICFVMSSFLANLTVFPVEASEENLIPKNEFEDFKLPTGTEISDAI